MKKKYLSLLAACSFLFAGCSDFLDMNPNGILDEESVSGVEQLDKLVISAYSMLLMVQVLHCHLSCKQCFTQFEQCERTGFPE